MSGGLKLLQCLTLLMTGAILLVPSSILETRRMSPRAKHYQVAEQTSPLTSPIEIDRHALVALRPAAAARSLSVTSLVQRLVETIAEDDPQTLVKAILDD
jgi:hypothetical protein